MLKKYYSFNKKRFSNLISPEDTIKILILTFEIQDSKILLSFLKNILERIHFKKHKKILSLFFDLIKKSELLFTLTPVKGFVFDIRGKVGVSGNAKKRHIFFSKGKTSTTTQQTRTVMQQMSV